MAPKLTVEFIVLKIRFVPFAVQGSNPTAMARDLSYPTIIGLSVIRSWVNCRNCDLFQGVMNAETPKLSPGIQARFSEWSFKTSDIELLMIGEDRYDEIYVVLGGERVYWLFYSADPYIVIQGSSNLEVAYCACCLCAHYVEIIAKIKHWINQPRK